MTGGRKMREAVKFAAKLLHNSVVVLLSLISALVFIFTNNLMHTMAILFVAILFYIIFVFLETKSFFISIKPLNRHWAISASLLIMLLSVFFKFIK